MGNVFTLDSLRAEVDKDFSPAKITLSDGSTVVLRNLLRLKKKDRDAVLEKLTELDKVSGEGISVDDIATAVDVISGVLTVVADHPKELLKELDGDLQVAMKVLEVWMEATQPGEASNSPA